MSPLQSMGIVALFLAVACQTAPLVRIMTIPDVGLKEITDDQFDKALHVAETKNKSRWSVTRDRPKSWLASLNDGRTAVRIRLHRQGNSVICEYVDSTNLAVKNDFIRLAYYKRVAAFLDSLSEVLEEGK